MLIARRDRRGLVYGLAGLLLLGLWASCGSHWSNVRVTAADLGAQQVKYWVSANTTVEGKVPNVLRADAARTNAVANVEVADADTTHKRIYRAENYEYPGFKWDAKESFYIVYIPLLGSQTSYLMVRLRPRDGTNAFDVAMSLRDGGTLIFLEPNAAADLQVDQAAGVVQLTWNGFWQMQSGRRVPFAGKLVAKGDLTKR